MDHQVDTEPTRPTSMSPSSPRRSRRNSDPTEFDSDVEVEEHEVHVHDDETESESGDENANGYVESGHRDLRMNGFGDVRDEKGKGVAPTDWEPDVSLAGQDRQPERKKAARSWTDLDLSLVVALVSPIGNWLTGSDHVKNLFLILLLVFYLHQLIEVPWQLYHASRPRKSARRVRTSSDAGTSRADATKTAAHALSELHALELFYLSLTVISPLLGAMLIRYVLTALEGVDNLSWFSTTLFVLATGIRPWSHLIARLRHRTGELHDAVHYPSHDSEAYHQMELERKLRVIMQRLDSLEHVTGKLQGKSARIEPLEEVCDDLSEALGDVERSVARYERKAEGVRLAQDTRLAVVETGLVQLEDRRKRDIDAIEATLLSGRGRMYSPYHPYLASFMTRILEIPYKLGNFVSPYIFPFTRSRRETNLIQENGSITHISLRPVHTHTHETVTQYVSHLETIPEAEDSDSEGTYVSDKDASQPSTSPPKLEQRADGLKHRSRSRTRSRSDSRPISKRQMSYQQKAYDYALNAVTWPYRTAVRILVMIAPPVQKLLV